MSGSNRRQDAWKASDLPTDLIPQKLEGHGYERLSCTAGSLRYSINYLNSIVGIIADGLNITLYCLVDTLFGARASEKYVTLSESPK